MKNIILSILFSSLIFLSCKKEGNEPEPSTQPTETGSVQVKFEHMVGEDAFAFNQTYTNDNSETYQITKFKYYVSNVELQHTNGSVYKIPESYFVVDAANTVSGVVPLTLSGIPTGQYKSISFLIGVDSARNVSGAQTGGLDPAGTAKDMYWSWNTGYIFLKFEGTSPQSTATDNTILYHVGGFRNATNTNALKTITLPFNTSVLTVNKTGLPQIHVSVDASRVVAGRTFSTNSVVHMPGATANDIAAHYANMFTFEHLHN